MRPRAQTLGFAGSLLFRIGAAPPMPLAPWHPAHPFERYARAPSLALPFPGGSSTPVGPIEMSRARISSAVGVRPMHVANISHLHLRKERSPFQVVFQIPLTPRREVFNG